MKQVPGGLWLEGTGLQKHGITIYKVYRTVCISKKEIHIPIKKLGKERKKNSYKINTNIKEEMQFFICVEKKTCFTPNA